MFIATLNSASPSVARYSIQTWMSAESNEKNLFWRGKYQASKSDRSRLRIVEKIDILARLLSLIFIVLMKSALDVGNTLLGACHSSISKWVRSVTD